MKMKFTLKQIETKVKIEFFARLFGIDSKWAVAIAMVESSLGINQSSPTGCLGIFNMSTVAMRDLRKEMAKSDNDLIDIACGVGFLSLLLDRWKSIEEATAHFCNPADKEFYLTRVNSYMSLFNAMEKDEK